MLNGLASSGCWGRQMELALNRELGNDINDIYVTELQHKRRRNGRALTANRQKVNMQQTIALYNLKCTSLLQQLHNCQYSTMARKSD